MQLALCIKHMPELSVDIRVPGPCAGVSTMGHDLACLGEWIPLSLETLRIQLCFTLCAETELTSNMASTPTETDKINSPKFCKEQPCSPLPLLSVSTTFPWLQDSDFCQ